MRMLTLKGTSCGECVSMGNSNTVCICLLPNTVSEHSESPVEKVTGLPRLMWCGVQHPPSRLRAHVSFCKHSRQTLESLGSLHSP